MIIPSIESEAMFPNEASLLFLSIWSTGQLSAAVADATAATAASAATAFLVIVKFLLLSTGRLLMAMTLVGRVDFDFSSEIDFSKRLWTSLV